MTLRHVKRWERLKRAAGRGFTLVEVLVALLIMAIVSALAWRGMDTMLVSRDTTRATLERTARLHTVMTQWQQDLGALFDSTALPSALAFDGQSLRLLRTVDGGVRLVTWSLRQGVWQRAASPLTTRVGELTEYWLRSQQLQGNEPEQLNVLEGVDEWQVYFFRGNAWSNAQSSAGAATTAPPPAPGVPAVITSTRAPLPSGVRLVLRINGQSLTRDLALVPQS